MLTKKHIKGLEEKLNNLVKSSEISHGEIYSEMRVLDKQYGLKVQEVAVLNSKIKMMKQRN